MDCLTAFFIWLSAKGYGEAARFTLPGTGAVVGQKEDKEGTEYLAFLATSDELSEQLAQAKGYRWSQAVCNKDGKPVKVWFQVKRVQKA
jgi:hypothetical protein